VVAIAAAICAGLAAAGFLLGHHPRGAKTGPLSVAVAGPLQLTFRRPKWQPAAAQPLPGLPVAGTVSLASTDPNHPGSLLAGSAPRATTERLVPAALVGKTEPQGRPARAATRALRYSGLHRNGAALTLYALQTGNGPATIACSGDATAIERCESIATTLAIQGTALKLGADARYAGELRRAMGDADRPAPSCAPPATRPASATATRPPGRASPCPRRAERAAGPHAAPPRARAGAVRYLTLATALQAGDRRGYLAAARTVRTAERTADAALRSLRPLGYAPR